MNRGHHSIANRVDAAPNFNREAIVEVSTKRVAPPEGLALQTVEALGIVPDPNMQREAERSMVNDWDRYTVAAVEGGYRIFCDGVAIDTFREQIVADRVRSLLEEAYEQGHERGGFDYTCEL